MGGVEILRKLERVEALLDDVCDRETEDRHKIALIDLRSKENEVAVFGRRDNPSQPSIIGRLAEIERLVVSLKRSVTWVAGPSLATMITLVVIVWKIFERINAALAHAP